MSDDEKERPRWPTRSRALAFAIGALLGIAVAPLCSAVGLKLVGSGALLAPLSTMELWLVAVVFSGLPTALLYGGLARRRTALQAEAPRRDRWLLHLRSVGIALCGWLLTAVPAGARLDTVLSWLLLTLGALCTAAVCSTAIQLTVAGAEVAASDQ